ANLAYCLTYAWLAQRLRWLPTLVSSALVFFAATFALQLVQLSLPVIFGLLVMGIIVARTLLPRTAASHSAAVTTPPRWDLPLRMVLATGIVLLLSESASALGPRLTGLLTPFPLYVSILAAFAHHLYGAAEAVRVLRGLIGGLFAFAVFF